MVERKVPTLVYIYYSGIYFNYLWIPGPIPMIVPPRCHYKIPPRPSSGGALRGYPLERAVTRTTHLGVSPHSSIQVKGSMYLLRGTTIP